MLEQFYLCRHADGRIVLAGRPGGVGAIDMSGLPELDDDGKPVRSAWQVVRDRVEDALYVRRPGYGFFAPGSAGA